MPHPEPEVAPEAPQDWRGILDRELARLPEKYRVPVVLYHLEGRPHREVARQLGLPEGTLSSRLATARQLLGKRLARAGVGLPAGALVVALSESAALATVPGTLVSSTVRAATLLAAGEAALATLATPAVALMKGALQTMFLQKLKVVAATAVVILALGVGGLAYRAGGQAPPPDKQRGGKPLSEVEALRRENQLLKLNLEVVLEKVAQLETEVRGLRGKTDTTPLYLNLKDNRADDKNLKRNFDKDKGNAPPKPKDPTDPRNFKRNFDKDKGKTPLKSREDSKWKPDEFVNPKTKELRKYTDKGHADLLKQAEDALSALRNARDTESQRKAADALEKALRSLRGTMKPADNKQYTPDKKKG
jgi:hypothetical protein